MQVDSSNVAQQDTLIRILQDTVAPVGEPIEESITDTGTQQENLVPEPSVARPVIQTQRETVPASRNRIQTEIEQESEISDTVQVIEETKEEPFVPIELFPNLRFKDSAIYKAKSNAFSENISSKFKTEITEKERYTRKSAEKGWVFGISILSALLLIVVRVYFQKYLSTIISSSVNFQLADKLIREKSILVRRVFTLLNINFLISASLFIYIGLKRLDINLGFLSNLYLFLVIFGCLFLVLFIRLILMNIIAGLFESQALFREFIHNSYLLNKNLGLYLLPLVISIFYLPLVYADIVFFVALGLVILTFIYRYFRSLQIILKHKVLYFYTILYLCTLEILPALVGVKFVLSLR